MESVDNEPEILALVFLAGLIAIFNIVVVKAIVSRLGTGKEPIRIHPYEIAYLSEGKLLSIQAVICYLMAKGIVKLENSDGKDVIVQNENSIEKLSELHNSSEASKFYSQRKTFVQELEKDVCQSLHGKSRTEIESDSNLSSFESKFDQIEEKLISQGLLFPKWRKLVNKSALFVASVFPVALILITRIVELSSTNRSILIESIITLVALGIACTAAKLSVDKSKKSSEFFSGGKIELSTLVKSFNNKSLSMSSEDFVRAFALSGSHLFVVIDEQSEFRSFFFSEIKSISEYLDEEDEED